MTFTTAKKCKKGFSCKASCIARDKSCLVSVGESLNPLVQFLQRSKEKAGALKQKAEEVLSGKKRYGEFEPIDPGKVRGKIGHGNTFDFGYAKQNADFDPETNEDDRKHPERQISNWKEVSEGIARATGLEIEEAKQTMIDVLGWSAFGYREIRAAQRGEDLGKDGYIDFKDKDDAARAARQLDRFIQAAPKYEGAIYRGLEFKNPRAADEFIRGLQEKGEMQMDTLSSWTSSPSMVKTYAYGNDGTSGVILSTVNRKNGVSIERLSAWSSEKEVLVGTGASYRVVGMQRRRLGPLGRRIVWEVVLEEK